MTHKQPWFTRYVVAPCLAALRGRPVPPMGPAVALLIDGENFPPGLAGAALAEAAKHGPVHVRRVYANWAVASQRWIEPVARHNIRAIHHQPAVARKNAIDIALVVDAMDLLHAGAFGCFCLVASDSDYTPLVARLCAAGRTVVVIGKANTPQALVQACSLFVPLEQLGAPPEPPAPEPPPAQQPEPIPPAAQQPARDPAPPVPAAANPPAAGQPPAARQAQQTSGQPKAPAKKAAPAQEKADPGQSGAKAPTGQPAKTLSAAQRQEVRELLLKAWNSASKQEDGWLFAGTLGLHLKQHLSTFNPKTYGYSRLGLLLQDQTDMFKLRSRSKGQYDVRLIETRRS